MQNNNTKTNIWAFGGGKGGVGKSVITANLGIALAQKGYKILLVDADFGAANLHTILGMNLPSKSLSDIFFSSVPIQDVIHSTNLLNIDIIGGAYDALKVTSINTMHITELLVDLKKLDYNYILIDLGAGTMDHTIEMFIGADKGILVAMPEATSIENTYRFMKYAFYKNLKNVMANNEIKNFIENLLRKKEYQQLTPSNLIAQIEQISKADADTLRKELFSYSLKIVLNQVRNNNDVRLGFSMSASCLKYFSFRLDYVGFMESNEEVLHSLRSRKPLFLVDPFSKSARGIRKIGEKLINNEHIVTAII